MELKDIVERIAEAEWPMFRSVNGDDRVDCQEDREAFLGMRRAQFSAWSTEAAESYLRDLESAKAVGRNLAREKYIRMMRSTDPKGYEAFKSELPLLSAAQEELIEAIWTHLLAQTERMREKYPAVAMGGRPLRAAEETDGWASIETYQTGELATYSEETLRALLAHIEALEARGVDLAFEIQRASVAVLGYRSMDDAERAMAFSYIRSMGGGECEKCGAMEDRCYI